MSDAGYMLPAISLIVALNAQFIGTSLGVIDHPLRSHKTHDKPTPLVGGFAVVLPLMTYCMIVWWVQPQSVGHAVFAFAIGGAFGLGFMDDRNQLPSLFRLIFVVVLTLIVFSMMPGLVVRVFDFAFLSEPIFLAPFSIAFSVLVVVGMVNAINMTDGMNGLACGLGLIWSLFLLFYAPPEYLEVVVLLALCLFITLIFNLRGRLFLGDSGSYTVGLAISLLTIFTYNASGGALHADVVVAWFIVPVVDCLRLMAVRASKRHSPMQADTDHLHHRLQRIMPASSTLIVYWILVAIPGAVAMAIPAFALYAVLAVVSVYTGLLFMTARPFDAGIEKEAA